MINLSIADPDLPTEMIALLEAGDAVKKALEKIMITWDTKKRTIKKSYNLNLQNRQKPSFPSSRKLFGSFQTVKFCLNRYFSFLDFSKRPQQMSLVQRDSLIHQNNWTRKKSLAGWSSIFKTVFLTKKQFIKFFYAMLKKTIFPLIRFQRKNTKNVSWKAFRATIILTNWLLNFLSVWWNACPIMH